MMTTYTRRGPGQSFLKTVLADRINSLIELKRSEEAVTVLKVYQDSSPEKKNPVAHLPSWADATASGGHVGSWLWATANSG